MFVCIKLCVAIFSHLLEIFSQLLSNFSNVLYFSSNIMQNKSLGSKVHFLSKHFSILAYRTKNNNSDDCIRILDIIFCISDFKQYLKQYFKVNVG